MSFTSKSAHSEGSNDDFEAKESGQFSLQDSEVEIQTKEEGSSVSTEEIIEEHPYGPEYEEITKRHLKEIAYELGLIKLCWPEDTFADAFPKHVPNNYRTNSKKEKVLLWYAENFRRQYHFVHVDRKPLFLAAENEYEIQKMVCSTIRPTSLPYPELYTWEGCTGFIADHLKYDPLEKPDLLPDRLSSLTLVLLRQRGHCFEFSSMLVAFLLAAGYDAYVVSGYATREVCLNDQTRVVCPMLREQPAPLVETVVEPDPRYQMKPPRDLRSRFVLEMEERQRVEEQRERDRVAEELRRAEEEWNRPPPDYMYGLRVHSWVLLLPGRRDITEAFFVEPTTGERLELDEPSYLGLESVWNNVNYWVNVQNCSTGCKDLKFDLTDISCWEHVLPGEPWETRRGDQAEELDQVRQEKHLDAPASWVERLTISVPRYMTRYPGGSRTVLYKKGRLELFAPYVQRDGMTRRIITYDDYEWNMPQSTSEMYVHREDCLERAERNHTNEHCEEFFGRGRADALRHHGFYVSHVGVDDERNLEFYDEARLDGLQRLDMQQLYLSAYYVGRDDRLFYRHAEFLPRAKTEGSRRVVTKLVERYHRNPDLPASEDVAQVMYYVADNRIHLKYHYEVGNVSAATREFMKPPMAERGDRLSFDPELTTSYNPDMTAPRMKQLDQFLLLEKVLRDEEEALHNLRDIEDEVSVLLRQRIIETSVPHLNISVYDRERNQQARDDMKERDEKMRAQCAREVEQGIDYLSPYLERYGNPTMLSEELALKIRTECLSDFKQLMVDRANAMQVAFEHETAALSARHQWYEEEQDALTRAEEEDYFEQSHRTAIRLHALEVRLLRHKDLAPHRYLALETCLRMDKRLEQLY